MQQVHAQPNAIRGTLQLPFPSEEEWKKRLTEAGEGNYGLVACIEGEVVGMVWLSSSSKSPRRKHVGYIGMAVHEKWQSKGVGTAMMKALIDLADNWLNLSRLELTVYTDSEPAIRLTKKLGFEIEGTQKKFAFRDGTYVDAYAMARVR